MGSVDRRIEELERSFAESPQFGGGGGGEAGDMARRFVTGVLTVIIQIRRQPIDLPLYWYRVDKLPTLNQWSLAQHLAALRILEHEDEDEARALFDGDSRLEKLINISVEIAKATRSNAG